MKSLQAIGLRGGVHCVHEAGLFSPLFFCFLDYRTNGDAALQEFLVVETVSSMASTVKLRKPSTFKQPKGREILGKQQEDLALIDGLDNYSLQLPELGTKRRRE